MVKRTAAQVKAEIKVLQQELRDMGKAPDFEKLEEFHNFCVEHFGRRLVVGDKLERNMMVFGENGGSVLKTIRVQIVKPKHNDWEPYDDVARIWYGYPNIDIKQLTRHKFAGYMNGAMTKTELRKQRLL